MTACLYATACWLLLVGCFGIARSHDLVHTVVSLSVAQSATYVLLLGTGFQHDARAPVFTTDLLPGTPVVDPVVQAMTLTDIVVAATVTALLLALTLQIAKQHGTTDPDELRALKG